MMERASVRARLRARMMTTGWMLRSRWGSAETRISPARMMIEVVPSPHSCAKFRYRRPSAQVTVQQTPPPHLVLCPTEFDHGLCGRMCDFDLSKDGPSVVRVPV